LDTGYLPFTIFCGFVGLVAFCRSVHQWQYDNTNQIKSFI